MDPKYPIAHNISTRTQASVTTSVGRSIMSPIDDTVSDVLCRLIMAIWIMLCAFSYRSLSFRTMYPDRIWIQWCCTMRKLHCLRWVRSVDDWTWCRMIYSIDESRKSDNVRRIRWVFIWVVGSWAYFLIVVITNGDLRGVEVVIEFRSNRFFGYEVYKLWC